MFYNDFGIKLMTFFSLCFSKLLAYSGGFILMFATIILYSITFTSLVQNVCVAFVLDALGVTSLSWKKDKSTIESNFGQFNKINNKKHIHNIKEKYNYISLIMVSTTFKTRVAVIRIQMMLTIVSTKLMIAIIAASSPIWQLYIGE